MTTTVNQKVANPYASSSGGDVTINTTPITGGTSGNVLYDNAGTVGEKAVTGTGSVVLSNSPTLTGNISANVNLRADTLSTLLPLAGGASEIGYATDANAFVRFNGAAGEAQILPGGSILNFTLTTSNYAALINPASGVYIDCNNITQLNLSLTQGLIDLLDSLGIFISNINIKFPNSLQIKEFKVYIPKNAGQIDNILLYITPAFQATDPAQLYNVIEADQPTEAENLRPRFSLINFNHVNVTFIGDPYGGGASWSRLPLQGEGAWAFANPNYNALPLVGVELFNSGVARTLATGVVQSSSTLVLPSGLWMITGYVNFNLTATTVATEIIASAGLNTTTTAPAISDYFSTVRTTANLPSAGNITLALPPLMKNSDLGLTIYGNVRATFSAGTIIATVYQKAIRIA
jgi:hypothetical protein